MSQETSKAKQRRYLAGHFGRYLTGYGIDIGCGDDPLTQPDCFKGMVPFEVRTWDWNDGDAQLLASISDETFDFVYSSHCLEHVRDPQVALENWWRVLKPSGHLFVMVPDEDLYEQGYWPSKGNGDHKSTWSISKEYSWSPVHKNVVDVLKPLANHKVMSIQLIDAYYDYAIAEKAKVNNTFVDQSGIAEVGIEFIVKKGYRLCPLT